MLMLASLPLGNGAFEFLKQVDARDAGGHAAQSYVQYDARPAKGVNYYRLRSTDADGGHSWSEVRALHFGAQARQLRVYPNPTKGVVNVAFSEETNARLRVYDGRSKLVKDVFVTRDNAAVDLSGLGKGVYYYSVQTEENMYHGEVVVQ